MAIRNPKAVWRAPGVYRIGNKLVRRLPKTAVKINKKNGKSTLKGKEVTVRESDAPMQIVYGEMMIGGAVTFIETSSDTKAQLQTGSENSIIAWTAKAFGSSGNLISVEIESLGTNASIIVTVVGQAINVRVKSTSGSPESTANQIITAIRGDASANALVHVSKGEGDGTGVVQPESETNLTGGGGTWLHQFITLAGHQLDSIQKLYLDDREVSFGATPDPRWATGIHAEKVFMAKQWGTDSQEAQPDLVAQLPTKWTEDHKQSGCAGVYLILKWNQNLFPEGNPKTQFLVHGRRCYDPRTATTVWTQNAALVIANYLTDSKHGLGASWSDIDETSLIEAANVCDEDVDLAAGGTEKRYSINCAFNSSDSPRTVLEEMAAAIAGDIVYHGGKWRIFPAKWRSPSLSLTQSDFRGPATVKTRVSQRDNYNRIKGTFISPASNWEVTDFPAVKNAFYLSQDGGIERFREVEYSMVTSSATCQRLSKIELERIRQPIVVQRRFGLRAYQVQVCDTVTLTDSRYGWSAKEFEVRDVQLVEEAESGLSVELVLKETAEAVYDWSMGEETAFDVAENSGLPDASTCLPPTAVILTSGTSELYIRSDGTVMSRLKVEWTPPNDQFVTEGGEYQVQHKRSAVTEWSQSTILPGSISFTHLLDVEDAVSYDVRIRSVNALGVTSDWVTGEGHLVIGKTEPPSDVASFSASVDSFGVLLAWGAISDVDASRYEIRQGASWASSTFIATIQGTSHRLALQAAGSYTFLIKAIDTSENYSTNAASASAVIAGPSEPSVSFAIEGQNITLSWTEPSSQFAIDSYQVTYGDVYSGSTPVAEIRGNALSVHVDWGSLRRFWVAGLDVAGNIGTASSVDVNIVAPEAVTGLGSKVVDNNVLLSWDTSSAGSLPVAYYQVRKGDVFSTAEVIGEVGGTFSAIFEIVAGTYTYWVVAVDTAGNQSTESSITSIVNEPPDFVLRDAQDIAPGDWDTLTNIAVEGDLAILPVLAETFEDHFIDNSWSTPQNQIEAGFPRYLQPTPATAQLETTIDYEALIESGTLVNLNYLVANIAGTVTVTPTISWSPDNSTWDSESGVTQVYATNFRYVKITLDAAGSDNHALATLSNARVVLSVKERTDQGTGTVTDSVNGVVVAFNKNFVSVIAIQVTPDYNASYGVVAVVAFAGDTNPTDFTVYLYRADTGAKVTGGFSWTARGV